MSERYSRLFALTADLYGEGSPVVIAAGALLKDNQNGKVLAQLKFRSLSNKRIKALTVALIPKDVAGVELEQVTHRYLDLDAGRDAEFCQKMPVFLPNAETRSFGAAVTQVFFADGSVWETENLHWEPLPKPESAAKIGDAELAKQYRMEYGSYLMQEHKELWFCSCGAVNRLGMDTTCHSCRKALSDLRSLSWEDLGAHKNARLAEEAARAEEARLAAEKRNRNIAGIAVRIVVQLVQFLSLCCYGVAILVALFTTTEIDSIVIGICLALFLLVCGFVFHWAAKTIGSAVTGRQDEKQKTDKQKTKGFLGVVLLIIGWMTEIFAACFYGVAVVGTLSCIKDGSWDDLYSFLCFLAIGVLLNILSWASKKIRETRRPNKKQKVKTTG